jgi:hypothetical protein
MSDISIHAQAKQRDFLTSCNTDDQLVMAEAQEMLKEAQERLELMDPLTPDAIKMEQAMIRLAKERISLLRGDIEVHAHKLHELSTVAKRLPEDENGHVPGKTEPSDIAGSSRRKGKKKVQATQNPSIHQPVRGSSLSAGTQASNASFPMHIQFPSIQGTLEPESRMQPINNKTEASSTDSKGESERQIEYSHTKHFLEALKSVERFLKSNDPKDFKFKFRKQAREKLEFFPDASFTSIDVTKLIFESVQSQSLSEYHRKGKDNFKADTVIELFGAGFKGQSVSDSSKLSTLLEGHCGCPIHEVAMEFFLWNTTRAFSSNPKLAGRSYGMEELSKLKPSTRTFWNKSIRDYTGLQTVDLLSPDYGSNAYAMRLALFQLHTQIERLKALKTPLVVEVKFPDLTNIVGISQEMLQYGIDSGLVNTSKALEQYWGEIKATRRVFPLPFIKPTRDSEDQY